MSAHNRPPNVEFQWTDGAWYDVSIRLVNSCLHVHYRGLSNVYDEIWGPEKFSSGEQVRSRFRLSSEQLQDEYCSQVKVGMCICTSCTSDGYDNRFFDAVVQEIHHTDHHLEECTCVFQVLWLAGPFADQRSYVFTENICLLKAGNYIETHPVLQRFATLVDNMHSRTPEYVGRNFPLKRYRNRTNTREHEQVKPKAEERLMEWGNRKKRTCTRIIYPGKMTGCSLEGTNLKMNKKEEKNDLPNLNLLPVQLDDTVEVTENVKARNGWLEAEQGEQLSFSEHLILDNLEKDVSPADVISVRNRTNTREHEQVKPKAEERPMEWESRKKRTCTRIIDPGKMTGCSLEGTNLKMNKKEEKNDLPDLNLLPVQLDDTVEVTENVNAGNGWLEAEQGEQLSFSEHLILDNLEKDVSPADVISVISIVTLEVLRVFIFPFSKFEKCTRAIVWFKDHESLMKAYAFLQNDYCIVCPNGRPWVVLDPQDEYGVYEEPCGGLSVQTSCSTNSTYEHIMTVRKGSRAYEEAKAKKDRFLEFKKHQAFLHRKWVDD